MLALESKKADLQLEIDEEKLNKPIPLVYDEIVFWLESFMDGDTNCKMFRELLIDVFVNKVILYNDKIIIVYNIKDGDNEKITVEEIIKDFSNGDSLVFEYERSGATERATFEQ